MKKVLLILIALVMSGSAFCYDMEKVDIDKLIYADRVFFTMNRLQNLRLFQKKLYRKNPLLQDYNNPYKHPISINKTKLKILLDRYKRKYGVDFDDEWEFAKWQETIPSDPE